MKTISNYKKQLIKKAKQFLNIKKKRRMSEVVLEDMEDEISKETLISLLKDKSKEIKTLTIKLQKLEEKYVKNYKEVKLIKKDYENIIKLMRTNIFDKPPYLLSALSVGEYEYESLHELWIHRDTHTTKSLTNLLAQLNEEKQEA